MRITRLQLCCSTLVVLATVTAVQVWSRLHAAQDAAVVVARGSADDGAGSVELLSQAYHLDRVYTSMTGPRSNHPGIRIDETVPSDETLWLTGIDTQIVEAETLSPESTEFLCHSHLTLSPGSTTPERHNGEFDPPTHSSWRLFTLVPGRLNIQLPDGFGIPIKNGTALDYFTMALNQNPGVPERVIRMKTNLSYRRAVAGVQPPRSLFTVPLYVYQQHTEKPDGGPSVSSVKRHQGECCAESSPIDRKGALPSRFLDLPNDGLSEHPGASCCVMNATADGIVDQFGKENTVHWMVPPGRFQYKTDVTNQIRDLIPFDTTAHYVTGHLHPYGESVKLVDKDTGRVVIAITGKHRTDRLGVEEMSVISSPEGIQLQPGHEYELIADYNNTSDHPIDAMALLYMYVLDEEHLPAQ